MKHAGDNPYMYSVGFWPCCREFWFDITHPRQLVRRMRKGLPEAWREFQDVLGR